MKLIVPDYYEKFACIADRCRHNCCIGWEIDIDDDTLELYNSLPGEVGERIRGGITYGETPCFKLCAGDRCAFLNDRGLCEIILALGEDGLCDICTDHPRFRNFFSDRCEIGLGLCCEEACRLILGWKSPLSLTVLEDDGDDEGTAPEEEFFCRREAIFRSLCDRSLPMDKRLTRVSEEYGVSDTDSPADWAHFYRSLERLDPAWDRYLDILSECGELSLPDGWDIPAEQLAVYFVYRHGGDAVDLPCALSFALHATRLIFTLHAAVGGDFGELCEICRLYSSEIEYSEENTAAVICRVKAPIK